MICSKKFKNSQLYFKHVLNTKVPPHLTILIISFLTIHPVTGRFATHADETPDAIFSLDDQLLVTWVARTIRIFRVKSGVCLRTLHGAETIRSVLLATSNQFLVSLEGDECIRQWYPDSRRPTRVLRRLTPDTVESISLAVGNNLLACGDTTGTILVWDLGTWSLRWALTDENGDIIIRSAFTWDDRFLAALGVDMNTITVWCLHTATQYYRVNCTQNWWCSFLAHTHVMLICGESSQFYYYDANTNTMLPVSLAADPAIGQIISYAYDSIRQRLVLVDFQGVNTFIRICDLNSDSSSCIMTYPIPSGEYFVCLSANGRMVLYEDLNLQNTERAMIMSLDEVYIHN